MRTSEKEAVMNLFIETQQQRAARLERDYARIPGGGGASQYRDAAGYAPEARRDAYGDRSRYAEARDGACDDRSRYAEPRGCYSVQQDSYREELAFDRARSRRRRLAAVLKVVALVIATPVALVVVFVAAYAFTCILNGATPDEVVVMLSDLANEVAGAVAAVLGMS